MKKSEFLQEYGMVVDYPEKCLSMVGKEVELSINDGKEKVYLCEDVRFSDATIVRKNKVKYLAIEFLVNNFTDEPFWTQPLPTEIKAPKRSKEFTNMMTEDAMKIVKENKLYE